LRYSFNKHYKVQGLCLMKLFLMLADEIIEILILG